MFMNIETERMSLYTGNGRVSPVYWFSSAREISCVLEMEKVIAFRYWGLKIRPWESERRKKLLSPYTRKL